MLTSATRVGTADDYLDRVCERIQLTETQFNTAERRYRALGAHLTQRDTSLDRLSPDVFPQGSMLMRTTVRPLRKDKDLVPFDLDSVCRCSVDPHEVSSQSLYGRCETRLRASTDYARRLSAEARCLRLSYEDDDFHLDSVPACVDPTDPAAVRILIPDRSKWQDGAAAISTWRRTDPLRYAAWFEAQCLPVRRLDEAVLSASVSPIPPHEPAAVKAPLRRVTQLLKRRRDLDFLGDECRPSSILLTTLAGRNYRGEEGVADALSRVLDGIAAQIGRAAGGRVEVLNPTDPTEDLASSLTGSAYFKFVAMIEAMRRDLAALQRPTKSADRGEALRNLAGSRVAGAVSAEVQREIERAGRGGALGVSGPGAGLSVLTEQKAQHSVRVVPSNTFHRDS